MIMKLEDFGTFNFFTEYQYNLLMSDRKQRFARVTKNLKLTSVFSTLVEEIKLIGGNTGGESESRMSDVMVPVAHSERSPVLLLMGGGMGAGKSTVLKDILKEYNLLLSFSSPIFVTYFCFNIKLVLLFRFRIIFGTHCHMTC